MPLSDGTFIVAREKIYVNVTWKYSEAGENIADEDITQKVWIGDKLAAPHDMQKEGYALEYWSDEEGNQYEYPPKHDLILYPHVTVHEHSWLEPEYVWADDASSCTATRVCAENVTHAETETVNAVGKVAKVPTCTAPGETTYTATFTNAAFAAQTKTVENIPALGHAYGEWVITNPKPVKVGEEIYEWQTGAKTRTCANDSSHTETEVIKVPTTMISTANAGVTASGKSASIDLLAMPKDNEKSFADYYSEANEFSTLGEVINNWVTVAAFAPGYEGWYEEGYTDEELQSGLRQIHLEGDEIVHFTFKDPEQAALKVADTENFGKTIEVEVTFRLADTETFEPLTGIVTVTWPPETEWGEPTYTWSEDLSECEARRESLNIDGYTDTELGNVTHETTKEATCLEAGEVTYTAAFVSAVFTEQKKTVSIASLGHNLVTDKSDPMPVIEDGACTGWKAGSEMVHCDRCDYIESTRVIKVVPTLLTETEALTLFINDFEAADDPNLTLADFEWMLEPFWAAAGSGIAADDRWDLQGAQLSWKEPTIRVASLSEGGSVTVHITPAAEDQEIYAEADVNLILERAPEETFTVIFKEDSADGREISRLNDIPNGTMSSEIDAQFPEIEAREGQKLTWYAMTTGSESSDPLPWGQYCGYGDRELWVKGEIYDTLILYTVWTEATPLSMARVRVRAAETETEAEAEIEADAAEESPEAAYTVRYWKETFAYKAQFPTKADLIEYLKKKKDLVLKEKDIGSYSVNQNASNAVWTWYVLVKENRGTGKIGEIIPMTALTGDEAKGYKQPDTISHVHIIEDENTNVDLFYQLEETAVTYNMNVRTGMEYVWEDAAGTDIRAGSYRLKGLYGQAYDVPVVKMRRLISEKEIIDYIPGVWSREKDASDGISTADGTFGEKDVTLYAVNKVEHITSIRQTEESERATEKQTEVSTDGATEPPAQGETEPLTPAETEPLTQAETEPQTQAAAETIPDVEG